MVPQWPNRKSLKITLVHGHHLDKVFFFPRYSDHTSTNKHHENFVLVLMIRPADAAWPFASNLTFLSLRPSRRDLGATVTKKYCMCPNFWGWRGEVGGPGRALREWWLGGPRMLGPGQGLLACLPGLRVAGGKMGEHSTGRPRRFGPFTHPLHESTPNIQVNNNMPPSITTSN